MVVDAITGTDETAYKSLDVGKRDTVVKNVLRWERSQIGEYLKIFFQGDWPQQNRSDLPCRVQANGDQVRRYQAKLCKVVLSDVANSVVQTCTLRLSVVAPTFAHSPCLSVCLGKPDPSNYQVARLRQQLQDQALDCHRCRLLQISVKKMITSLTCHKFTCCR